MMLGRISIIMVLGLLVLMMSSVQIVSAHSPSGMVLEYTVANQELSIQISHSVENRLTHYIEEIVVFKNDVQVDSETYTGQTSVSGMNDTFTIAAVAGDVLRVTAACSVQGSIARQITIATTTAHTDTLDNPWLLASALIFAVIIIVLVSVVVRRMR